MKTTNPLPLKRLTVRVPKRMITAIDEDRLKSGFNKKQLVDYYQLALTELFNLENYLSLITEDFIQPGTTHTITISMQENTHKKIEQAITDIKLSENLISDKSSVIRTALHQRLLKSVMGGNN